MLERLTDNPISPTLQSLEKLPLKAVIHLTRLWIAIEGYRISSEPDGCQDTDFGINLFADRILELICGTPTIVSEPVQEYRKMSKYIINPKLFKPLVKLHGKSEKFYELALNIAKEEFLRLHEKSSPGFLSYDIPEETAYEWVKEWHKRVEKYKKNNENSKII